MALKAKDTLIVFDFDGVICDSFQAMLESLNSISSFWRFRSIPQNEVTRLKSMGSREVIKYLEIPPWKLPLVIFHVRALIKKRIPYLVAHPGANDCLKSLQANGYSLGILSSNSASNIRNFLKQNDSDCFEFVQSTSFWGKAKRLTQIKNKFENRGFRQFYYVGDEERDVFSAREAQFKSVAVSWGLNDKTVLENSQPNYLLDSWSELRNVLPSDDPDS